MQNVPFALKEANLNLKALFLPDDGYDMYDLDISKFVADVKRAQFLEAQTG